MMLETPQAQVPGNEVHTPPPSRMTVPDADYLILACFGHWVIVRRPVTAQALSHSLKISARRHHEEVDFGRLYGGQIALQDSLDVEEIWA